MAEQFKDQFGQPDDADKSSGREVVWIGKKSDQYNIKDTTYKVSNHEDATQRGSATKMNGNDEVSTINAGKILSDKLRDILAESSTPPDGGGACFQNEETFTGESTEAGSTSSGSGSRQIDKNDSQVVNDRKARATTAENCIVGSGNDTKSETASDEGSNGDSFVNSERVAREISTEEGSTSSGSKNESRTAERGDRSASAEDGTVGSSGDNDNKSESASDGGSGSYGNVQRVVRDSSTEEGSTSSGSKHVERSDLAERSSIEKIGHNEKETRAQRQTDEATALGSESTVADAATRARQSVEIIIGEDGISATDSKTAKVGRVRRKNSELKKEFVCQYYRCGRSYASNHARLLHYTLKHRRGSVFGSLQTMPVRPLLPVIRPGQVNYLPLQMVPPGFLQVHRDMSSMVAPGQVVQMVRPMVRGMGQPIIMPQPNLLIPSRPLTHAQQPRAPVPATAQVKGTVTPKSKPQTRAGSGAGASKAKPSAAIPGKSKREKAEKLQLEAKLQAEHQAQVQAQAKAQVYAQAQAQVQAQAQAETARSKAQSRIQSHVQNQAWEQTHARNVDSDQSSSDDGKSSSNSDKAQLGVPGGSNPFSSSSGASLESNEGGGARTNDQGESSENAQPFRKNVSYNQKLKPASMFPGQQMKPHGTAHGLNQQEMPQIQLQTQYGNGFVSNVDNGAQHLKGGLLKGHTGQSPGERKEFYSGRAYPISSPKHHHAHPTDVFDDRSCQCARIARNGHGQCQGHVHHPMRGSHVHYRAKHSHLDAGSPPMQTDCASDKSFLPPSVFMAPTGGNGKIPMQYVSNNTPQPMGSSFYHNHGSLSGQVLNMNDANTGTTTSNSGGMAPVHFNTTGSSEEDRSTPPSGGTREDFSFHADSHNPSCSCSAHAMQSEQGRDKRNDVMSVATSAYTRDSQNVTHHKKNLSGVSPPWDAQSQMYGRNASNQTAMFSSLQQNHGHKPPHNNFIGSGQQGQQGMHDKSAQHIHRNRHQQLQALLQQQQQQHQHHHQHQQAHEHQRQQLQQHQQQLVQQAQMQDVVGQLDGTTATIGFNGKDMVSDTKTHRQSSRTQQRPEANSEDRARSRSFPRTEVLPKADRKRSGSDLRGHNNNSKGAKSPSRKRSRSHPRTKNSPSVQLNRVPQDNNNVVDTNVASAWSETLLSTNTNNRPKVFMNNSARMFANKGLASDGSASGATLGTNTSHSGPGTSMTGVVQNQMPQHSSTARDGSWARANNDIGPFAAMLMPSNGQLSTNKSGNVHQKIDDECCTIHAHNAINHASAQSSSDGNNGIQTRAGGGVYRGNNLNSFHGQHTWPAQNTLPQRSQFAAHTGNYNGNGNENFQLGHQMMQQQGGVYKQNAQNNHNIQSMQGQGQIQGPFVQHNGMGAPPVPKQQHTQVVRNYNMMMHNDFGAAMKSTAADRCNVNNLHSGFRSSMAQDQVFQPQYHPYTRHGASDLIDSLENSSTDDKVSSNQYSNDSPEVAPAFYNARYDS
ncbi:hypothetical protein SARC_11621 [Sphaeroforma arctica JP610]|uniref:C2H2-type domain-containing protein n=1 Tax=Sphaeroforma arctica JP610 TaxID=667725 RepID=A0A0L0FGF4_9EUKA|nr:hypothetical protein SARC_11621 [Sphaeroforma arctica JP610]KNC75862.1 hypothetical protein SARC_11621 [Sphaeroforma arctica JP610]|eukprot:XP_014149764.1 hypothetical protein SARC_11621 [Sphaeroforma arctica JP610]